MKKVLVLALALTLVVAGVSFAIVLGSKHDMSQRGGTLSACQYCHTPHLRDHEAVIGAPLWNREMPDAGTYSLYGDGRTLADTVVGEPGPNSLTCLSCHDGSIALESVLIGSSDAVTSLDEGDNPNANLGTDLSNEHPVGFDFVSGNAGVPDILDPFKLYNDGVRFECATCHDPHDTDTDDTVQFLRAPRTSMCTDCHSEK